MLVTQTSFPSSIDPHRPRATAAGNASQAGGEHVADGESRGALPLVGDPPDLGHAVGDLGVGGNDEPCGNEVVPPVAPLLSLSRTLTGMRARKPGETTPC